MYATLPSSQALELTLTGKKITKVKLESRKLNRDLALVTGRSACSS
jgi:hypothetical protein